MNEITLDTGEVLQFDRVEIMSNGWVKAIHKSDYEREDTQYPPHRVERITGKVVYYE